MTNKDVAQLLRNIAAAYELLGESRFRIIAYQQAADSIENLATDIRSIWEAGNIQKVSGIGGSLAQHLDELFSKGESSHFTAIQKKIPEGVFDMLKLRNVGPKTAYRIAVEMHKRGISGKTTYEKLGKILNIHALLELEGFGEKRESEIRTSLSQYMAGMNKKARLLYPEAESIATKLCAYIAESPVVKDVEQLGSFRRKKETIGDIDIAVSTKDIPSAIEHVLSYPDISTVDDRGASKVSVILDATVQADVRFVEPEKYGAMSQYFTGSKYHNIRLREYALQKGYSLSEYGIKDVRNSPGKQDTVHAFSTEKDFYAFLGLDYIPPEMREDRGEIDLAKNHVLPVLIEQQNMKGDLHIHGDFSYASSHDLGRSPLEQLLAKAAELQYEYIGISDHNPKFSGQTKKEINTVMIKRKEYYEQLYSSIKSVQKYSTVPKVFIMMEIDIRADGSLALPDESFSYLDAAIVSIHASFEQPKETMTARILKGLSHPKVKIFAHPTARMLNDRDSIQANWPEIFSYCAKRHIAVEINASPQRLDLPDDLIHEARSVGVQFVINTDSHHVDHMDNMRYGVGVARRGWLQSRDILNSLRLDEFEKWLKS